MYTRTVLAGAGAKPPTENPINGGRFNPSNRRLQGVGAAPERSSTTQPTDTTTGGGVGATLDSSTQNPNASKPEEATPNPGPSAESVSTTIAVLGLAVFGAGKFATCNGRTKKPSQVASQVAPPVAPQVDSQVDSQGRCSKAYALAGSAIQTADAALPIVTSGTALFITIARLRVTNTILVVLGALSSALGTRNLVKSCFKNDPESDNSNTTNTIHTTTFGLSMVDAPTEAASEVDGAQQYQDQDQIQDQEENPNQV
jgi:hypothetical protein